MLLGMPAWAQSAPRILQSVDAIRTTAHIDVVVLLNCRARYVTHTPTGESDVVHIRLSLSEDCGTNPAFSENLPVAAVADTLRSIEIAPLLAQEVDMAVQWTHAERFVVLPEQNDMIRQSAEAAEHDILIAGQRFARATERAFEAAVARTSRRAVMTTLVIFIVFAAVGFLLWMGGQDVIMGRITAGDLSAFVFYAVLVASSGGAISEIVTFLVA